MSDEVALAVPRASAPSGLRAPVGLAEHADEHRPKRPILLAFDQQLAKCPRVGHRNPIRASTGDSVPFLAMLYALFYAIIRRGLRLNVISSDTEA